GGLESGGHLLGIGRVHAAIVFPGQQKDGGVSVAIPDVLVRRVSVDGFELLRGFDGSVLGNDENAVWGLLPAPHMVYRNVAHPGPKQLGMLRQQGAHEQTAVAPALDGEPIRTCIAAVDEVLGAGGEVIKYVLLARQISGQVPIFTVLPTTTKVGNG